MIAESNQTISSYARFIGHAADFSRRNSTFAAFAPALAPLPY